MAKSTGKKFLVSSQLAALVLAIIIFILAAGTINAATALIVSVPWDRTYIYWISGPKGDESAPDRFKGKKATVEIPDPAKGNLTLVIYDISTGNEAVETIKLPIDPKGITLQKGDFDEVRRVRIKITADKGKPVESAIVTLKDISGKIQTGRVDPTTVGVAEFTDVTAGDGTVEIRYGDGKKTSQDITIDEERDTPIFSTEVPVAGPVVTISDTKTGATEETAEAAPARKSGSDWAAAILGTIFGFLALVGIILVLYFALRKKGVTVESSLQKMGVELPEAAPQGAAPAQPVQEVDPSICQFCGQHKDPQTGQCACTVAPQAAPAAGGTGPRLIATQGSYAANIYELISEVTTIGREPDNIIAMPDDTTVSRHHSRVARENGGYVIYDGGSSNGTIVNGNKITQQTLQPGDEIQIGTTKFRFEM
ncbi:MAG: FHA domain-containing protein [Armatimonadota bacterium]|nr:FHA domain-containing protein [Armatimonadota bacterium]